MKLYCMCQITGSVPKQAIDSQGFGPLDNQVFMAPNRFGIIDDDDDFRSVLLSRPMTCVKNGVRQKIAETENGKLPNMWIRTKEEAKIDFEKLKSTRRHYPNVDFYECPVCRAQIVLE